MNVTSVQVVLMVIYPCYRANNTVVFLKQINLAAVRVLNKV